MSTKVSTAAKKAAAATTTEASLAQQTAAFLNQGGAIQSIPLGVSGLYQNGGFQSAGQARKATAKKG
jgi:hypothetical protein